MEPTGTLTHFPDHESLAHFSQLATPIWVFDVDRHQVWWSNSAGVSFWEAGSLNELLERDFSTDSDTVRTRLSKIINDPLGAERLQDTWTLYPKGIPKTVILSFLPIRIRQNSNAVLIEVKQYIEGRDDQESLRILEAARVSALLVSTFTADGRLLAQNPAALNCYGSRPKGMLSNDLASRLKDPAAADALLQVAEGAKGFDTDQEVRTLQGFRVHRIKTRRGRDPVTGAFVAVISEEDITEQFILKRKMQELNEKLEEKIEERTQLLAESEERFALATQCAAIWDWDLVNNSLYLSPGFVEALGFEAEEFQSILAASSVIEFVHPDDVASYQAELARHLQEPESPFKHEHRFLTGTGDYKWFHALGNCVVDSDGAPARSVGLLTDISDRKQLEASLLVAQRLEAVGQLTGGIAHDFNNLLTVVQGNAELIEISGGPDRDLAKQIRGAALKGAELTQHLLAFSGKQTLSPKAVDLPQLVTEMNSTLLRLLGEEIAISTRLDDELWLAQADPTQVESALLNIAINARDAMPEGGELQIACRNRKITQSSSCSNLDVELRPGQYIEMTIRDTGRGMPQRDLDRAFEPFFTTKGVGQGSGLGLSMVLGFSRQSGGDAYIQSEPGKGTSVTILLPRSFEMSDENTKQDTGPSVPGNQEHIHFIEDSSAVRKTIQSTLEALNYQVTVSGNAVEAMSFASSGPRVDLFLVDVVLPGGESGLDFANRLKSLAPEVKVILISGYPQAQLSRAAPIPSGFTFLPKPITRTTLSRAIRSKLRDG